MTEATKLGSLGLGTYLGEADAAADQGYAEAARVFFELGGRVFDTAANYRGGRSERALGQVLPGLPRDSFFVSTKAGYLPMGDGLREESPRDWFRRVLLEPGILTPDEVVDGCHALTPKYLEHQLRISLQALGLDHVDLFHLHNPEQQRPHLGHDGFRQVMRRAFEACEALVAQGLTRAYGCATWNGFRVDPASPEHLSLEELLGLAREVGGEGHHFRWIQLPLNLGMLEAWVHPSQRFAGASRSALEAAQEAGIRVQTSASMLQGRLLPRLSRALVEALGAQTPAQAALQFTRSCPGVEVALCGMGRAAHVRENAAVLDLSKVSDALLLELVRSHQEGATA